MQTIRELQNQFSRAAIDLFNQASSGALPRFPFFDILNSKEGDSEIRIALAGYNESDVKIVSTGRFLEITSQGQGAEPVDSPFEFYHRGISKKAFRLVFDIPNRHEVQSAEFENGILKVRIKAPEDFHKTVEIPIKRADKALPNQPNGSGNSEE